MSASIKKKLIKNIIIYLSRIDGALTFPMENVERAFEKTIADVKYHYPKISTEDIYSRIISNNNELAIFLYRLGQIYYNSGDSKYVQFLHGFMRMACSCEIYFSNVISEGFYIVHSVGIVLGSRNKIGEGFLIYQNCTIGHETEKGTGAMLGHEVTMLPYSSIIGSIKIGDNVVIGAYSMIKNNCESNKIITGIPGNKISPNSVSTNNKFRLII